MMTERSPPDSIHTVIGAIRTFFGLLFILLVAIAVLSKGALKGPDAFVLRWTVLSLAVVFTVSWSGSAGAFRVRRYRLRLRSTDPAIVNR